MITKKDIKLRAQGDNITVWLSECAVVESCGVSKIYLDVRIRTLYRNSLPESWRNAIKNNEYYLGDSGRGWRYGYKDGIFWYSYDNIPDRAPSFYRSKLPTKAELIELARGGNVMGRENMLMLREEVSSGVDSLMESRDMDELMLYRHPVSNNYIIRTSEARSMAEATAWVLYIKEVIMTRAFIALGVATIAEFYELCAKMIESRNMSSIQRSNGRSLRNRITTLPDGRDEIRECIVSGKYGNRNAAIIGKKTMLVDETTGEYVEIALHDTIVLALWMNLGGAGKYTKVELYKRYQADMITMAERPMSLSSFSGYLNREDIKYLTTRKRHGKEYFDKMVQTYIPSRKLEYANSLWCADASGTINYAFIARNGKFKTRKLYTILISDVASGYIIGWAIGRAKESSENASLVREAVAKALLNPLNNNKEVLEFISDNHGAYSSAGAKQYLKRVARKVRRIKPHNSQGNPAERIFKVFKQSLKGLYNLMDTSFNATSIENQANPDYFKKDKLPTYSEAIIQLEQHILEFNNRELADGGTPAERVEFSRNPKCETYREETFRYLTQKAHKVDISNSRGFVEVTENYEKIKYELPTDVESIKQIAKYVGIKRIKPIEIYADGEKADIYSEDGVFMMTVSKATKACQSSYEATEMEQQAFRYHDARKESQISDITDFENELKDDLEILSNSFALNMAVGGYGSSPKKRYNATQEEARDAMITNKTKDARKAVRQKRKTKEDEHDSYMAMIEKRLQQQNNT